MPWTENPPTDVEVGDDGHVELHNAADRAIAEIHTKIDAIPAPTAPEVTKAQYDALVARVAALETA